MQEIIKCRCSRCKGYFTRSIDRKYINEKTGKPKNNVYCKPCNRERSAERKVGRSAQKIAEQVTLADMGCRILSRDEIAELEKIYHRKAG